MTVEVTRAGPAPPPSARVVIVGAGIAGVSLAAHLVARGVSDVVVLDRGPLFRTGGSTSHAPGLMFQVNPSSTLTRLARWSVELYSELELDGEPAFLPVGGIELATTPGRAQELERRLGYARSWGIEAELLDPGAVAELVPVLDPEPVLLGLAVPGDGLAKGLRIAEALARRAERAGASFHGLCPVTDVHVEGGRIRGVETPAGRVSADHVVLCAGVWGPAVGRLAGLRVPLAPFEHQYAVTAPLPELAGAPGEATHPMVRHQDHSMYLRQHGEAYGIGNYRHPPRCLDAEEIRESSDAGDEPALLPFTPEDFRATHAEAARLVPALAGAPLERTLNGLMSFTPDAMPLIGAAATHGLWLGEAIWVTHAGGAGRVLADLIVDGEAEVDLRECDPQRFDGHGLSPRYLRVRGAQQYREVYDVVHPRQQVAAPRGLRRGPCHPRHEALGAVGFESAGWERPQWYEANAPLVSHDHGGGRTGWPAVGWSPVIGAEHLATREHAGLFDLTPFTKVAVAGPGALAYLQWLTANDVDKPEGTIVYSAMLTARGGIMCDLTVTRTGPQEFLVVTGGSIGRHDLAWMRSQLPKDGTVVLTDVTSGLACLGLWGPRARDILAQVCEDPLDNDAFPFMRARSIFVGDVPVRALRISYVGELGWELYAPTEFGLSLWDALWEAGEAHGLVAAGGGAYDSLRLEKGYRLWGQDIHTEYGPDEAGLGFAVRLGKGPFSGREAVAAARDQGPPRRRLVCLLLDDPGVAPLGKEPLLDGEQVVGYVTSAGFGPTVDASIAYGYVPAALAEPGTSIDILVAGVRECATVAVEPLFDPEMHRLKDAPPVEAGSR